MVWRKMESEDLRWLSKWQSPSDKSSHHHYGPTLYLRYQPRSFGGDHHSATSTNPLYALLLTACLFVIYAPTHICCTVCVLVLLATLPEGTWEDGTPLEEHTGARIRHISIDHEDDLDDDINEEDIVMIIVVIMIEMIIIFITIIR